MQEEIQEEFIVGLKYGWVYTLFQEWHNIIIIFTIFKKAFFTDLILKLNTCILQQTKSLL